MSQSFLDERERAFLKEMKLNPIWVSILTKFRKYSTTPRFSPMKDEDQVQKWVYESGRLDELERILSLLTLEK